MTLTTLELCAGAGGQALGLRRAGFTHVALVDNDEHACLSLKYNFPEPCVGAAHLHRGSDCVVQFELRRPTLKTTIVYYPVLALSVG